MEINLANTILHAPLHSAVLQVRKRNDRENNALESQEGLTIGRKDWITLYVTSTGSKILNSQRQLREYTIDSQGISRNSSSSILSFDAWKEKRMNNSPRFNAYEF